MKTPKLTEELLDELRADADQGGFGPGSDAVRALIDEVRRLRSVILKAGAINHYIGVKEALWPEVDRLRNTCPQCGSKNLSRQRSPNGLTQCLSCHYARKHSEWPGSPK